MDRAPIEKVLFRATIAQDAFYWRAFLKACALARADDNETIAAPYELIGPGSSCEGPAYHREQCYKLYPGGIWWSCQIFRRSRMLRFLVRPGRFE